MLTQFLHFLHCVISGAKTGVGLKSKNKNKTNINLNMERSTLAELKDTDTRQKQDFNRLNRVTDGY
jgi:hypothetical protein